MKAILIFILFIIFYGCYLLFTKLLFGDNNLIMIEGQLYNKPITAVEHMVSNNKTVKCAVLNFTLKDDKRLYTIKLNIDSVYQGFNVLGGVDLSLENAGKIKVWIKKSDFNLTRPKVYSLVADDNNIYNQVAKPGNNAKLYSFIACLSLLFISIYYCFKNYEHIFRLVKTSAKE